MNFSPEFNPTDLHVLVTKNANTVVACYSNTFKNKELFHIRELYLDGEYWKPGKGVTMNMEDRSNVASILSSLES